MLQSLAVRAGASLPADAAAFRGEFKRDLIALGVVMLIMLVIWAFQEWGLRAAAQSPGKVGVAVYTIMTVVSIALTVAAIAGALIVLGLLL